jgi:hypothetical protein
MDTLNQNPIAGGSQMPPPEAPKSGVGPIAGAIIVILLLVAGGLYFWGAKLNEDIQNNTIPYIPDDAGMQFDATTSSATDTDTGFPPQSSSDDPSSIESDFNAMDFDAIDSQNEAELNNI